MIPNETREIAGDTYHVADHRGRQYVRITFRPLGAKRKRTTWAVVSKRTGTDDGPRGVHYYACDKHGDVGQEAGTDEKTGLPIERSELIIAQQHEVREVPAGYSFKYGELVELPPWK